MKFLYPRGCGMYPLKVVFDEFEYESEMGRFCRWMLRDQLKKPMNISETKMDYGVPHFTRLDIPYKEPTIEEYMERCIGSIRKAILDETKRGSNNG